MDTTADASSYSFSYSSECRKYPVRWGSGRGAGWESASKPYTSLPSGIRCSLRPTARALVGAGSRSIAASGGYRGLGSGPGAAGEGRAWTRGSCALGWGSVMWHWLCFRTCPGSCSGSYPLSQWSGVEVGVVKGDRVPRRCSLLESWSWTTYLCDASAHASQLGPRTGHSQQTHRWDSVAQWTVNFALVDKPSHQKF